MDKNRETEGLKSLGNNTKYSMDYAPEVLETFENKHPENDYWVRFNCPEFTSLCPITGQPDFAEIRISYVPNVRMVESKSLKLYLFSFRNHGDFHEDCVNIIMKDLIKLMIQSILSRWAVHTSWRHQHSPLCQLRNAQYKVCRNGRTAFRGVRRMRDICEVTT